MMKKFEDVDILAALKRIMEMNTDHYQSDFEIDIIVLKGRDVSGFRQMISIYISKKLEVLYCKDKKMQYRTQMPLIQNGDEYQEEVLHV